MRLTYTKKFASLVIAGTLAVSGCSNSSTKKEASGAQAKTKTTVTLANTSQRPSEINIPVSAKITRTGEIYLLRGLANVFSRGMDTMGAKMVRKGLDARVYNHTAWKDLANNILLRKKRKKISYPIVIMGHSLGADASTMMAKYLGDRGVRVDYVVAFDPTIRTSVGKNVKRVINYYLPNEKRTNIVVKAPGFKGTIKNINVSGNPSITHTNVEKNPKFHNQVINRTYNLTRRARKK